ncbi:MAG: hypothetical protein RLP15_11520 [Cryomorphaceae bacterium]
MPEQEDSFSRKIYGDKFAETEARWNDAVENIEQEYKDFFEEREPKFESQIHDRIVNHFMLYVSPPNIKFSIVKDSDLPKEIIEKLNTLFTEIWGTGN